MIEIKPIIVNNLFPILNSKLIQLLENLDEDSWYNNTACKDWCVKDIVQHLVNDYIGVLSRKRDNYRNPTVNEQKFKSNKQLVLYINQLNQNWVNATKQVSPGVLIQMLKFLGNDLFEYFNRVDLMKVDSGVSWISKERLPNWMDIAREYTEHWLHQAHIREAVNAPLLTDKQLFRPFIQTYMMALPKTYRNVDAEIGSKVLIRVIGESGGDWLLEKTEKYWKLTEGTSKNIQTEIKINQDVLWRLFSKGMKKRTAAKYIEFNGNTELGKAFMNTVSLIA